MRVDILVHPTVHTGSCVHFRDALTGDEQNVIPSKWAKYRIFKSDIGPTIRPAACHMTAQADTSIASGGSRGSLTSNARWSVKAALPALLVMIHCIRLIGQNGSADAFAQALNLIQKGQSASAIEILRPLAHIESQASPERARIQTMLGFAYKQGGQFALARQCYEGALTSLGKSAALDPDRATILDYFASLETDAGNTSSAENLFLQALTIDKRLMDHERLTDLYTHLAGLEIERRRFKEAQRYLDLAMGEQQQAGKSQTELLAQLYVTRGWLANASNHRQEAIDDYAHAVAACEKSYGEDHPLVAWSYLLLGKAQGESGDLSEGLDAMGKGLSILKNTVGTKDVRYLVGEMAYSKLLDRSGRHEEAQRLSAEAEYSLPEGFKDPCRNCSTSVWSLRIH